MPRPEAKLCSQKQQLLDAFLQAVPEVVELQDQQMTHFVEGGGGFERIDLLERYSQKALRVTPYRARLFGSVRAARRCR